jgi:DNA primase
MSLYTKDSVERVKDAVDMVELVGARTDLRRVGARFTGLCPFHDERTPSFSVNAEHKLFHCFGCGESGDAISFVEKTEALDFRQAVEFLGERYGVELQLEREDPRAEERRRRRERLLSLLERAAAFYARFLWESQEAARAREYLGSRGLREEVLRAFRVGYAPSAWDRLVVGAQRDGFRLEELAAAGLGQRGREGGFYDRFRGRIMFPLADPRGRVLGFGARAVRDEQRPKYLNTSESELYHKGRQLFGIDRARGPAAKAGRVLVVEGYTDVLALHQEGLEETVAIMGTAMTQEQLAELSRVANSVFLALDADRSGQEAMLRAAGVAGDRGVELRVIAMPEGSDPADLVAERGAAAFSELLGEALSVPEFQVRRMLADADLDSVRGRDRALGEARHLIATTPEKSATRDELVRYVADKLDVPVSYLMTQLAARAGRTQAAQDPPAAAGRSLDGAAAAPQIDAVMRAERAFLAMCLAQPSVGRDYLARLSDEHLSSRPFRGVRDHLLRHFDDPLQDLPADDPTVTALVTEITLTAEEVPSSESVLRMSWLQLELRRLERELRQAGDAADFERQRALWPAVDAVKREIDELMGQTQ